MSLSAAIYLVMNGNGQEALRFYEQSLGATITFKQTFGEAPENPDFPLPPEAKDRIMHASFKIGETELMMSDTFPGQPHQIGNQVTICVMTDSLEHSQQIYNALQDGGQVHMPFQATFFSPGYAIVTDKFGVTFQIYTEGKQ